MSIWQKDVFIIAEAGVNHNGNMENAFKLVDEAKKSGCNAVKFQTYKTENLVTSKAQMAEYQKSNVQNYKSQFEMLKSYELTYKDFEKLKQYCDQKKIIMISTAFDTESTEFLINLNLMAYKIPSGEINNFLYLRKLSRLNKPTILSTGMSTISDIDNAVRVLEKFGLADRNLCILHCHGEYPTKMKDVNLKAMAKIGDVFGRSFGYSDHTIGSQVSIAAVSLGAKVIEKHFTLDKTQEGPDHKASVEPFELSQMVKQIRDIETALGDGFKKPSEIELKNKELVRKSIVASKDILEGDEFTYENITVKRPSGGIDPMYWEEILGKKSKKNYLKDDRIQW